MVNAGITVLINLNNVHTVFGQVIEGMDTVLRMRNGDVMQEVKVWDEE
jgi:peptidyl-prolyl cis-trans isomerase B (cyclophilin B)